MCSDPAFYLPLPGMQLRYFVIVVAFLDEERQLVMISFQGEEALPPEVGVVPWGQLVVVHGHMMEL